MKKIYALLALATSLSAFAGTHLADQVGPKNTTFQEQVKNLQTLPNYTFIKSTEGIRKAPAKGPSLYNFWGYAYRGLTNQDEGWNISAVELEQTETNLVKVYGLGIVCDYPIEAIYDSKEMTLTFKNNQIYIPAQEWDGENPLWFGCVYQDENSNLKPLDSITLRYAPDGVQFEDGTVGYVGGWLYEEPNNIFVFNENITDNQGWVGSWKYANMFLRFEDVIPGPVDQFVYDYDEWNYIGESQFTDGWISSFFEEEAPAYDVPTYQNFQNHNLIMLKNPYGPDSYFADVNGSVNGSGYIILDVTDPECVLVRPCVRSGYSLSNPNWDFRAADIPVTNAEGIYYYIEGESIANIKKNASFYGDELSTMTEDGLVTIPEPKIQGLSPNDFYIPSVWVDWSTGVDLPMYPSQIQLPSLSGVNSIITDKDNANARYFNLQGVEIANPEAGQVVIVKEGKNSKKVIF